MPVKNVTVREAHQKQGQGYTYVDVRSVPEFVQSHPAGAVNVPLLHRDERTGQMSPNRDFLQVMQANFTPDTKLLVGCQVGGRSAQAAQVLNDAGFTDVSNVVGGFGGGVDQMTGQIRAEGWAPAGLPTEAGASTGKSYDDLRSRTAEGKRHE
jgi:rhodanese-related sulfurtransferase